MFDLAKLRPYVQIAIWLVICAVFVEGILTALSSTAALNWVPRTVTGTGFLEDSRLRVAQAEEEYRSGQIAEGEHLGILVGISNLREAIDMSLLTEGVGAGWRFLGIAGAGLGIQDVRPYAGLVLDSELRPDVVVLGLGLHQVLDYRPAAPGAAGDDGVWTRLRQHDLRGAAAMLRNASWIYARRRDVSMSVDREALEIRAALLGYFDVPLSETESAELSPWREMVRSGFPDHFSDSTLQAQEENFDALGIFDAARYIDSTSAFATLLEMVAGFQDKGATVLILLMPEHSRLRQHVPPEAKVIFEQRLREGLGVDTPDLLDYRDAVSDDGLVDLVHLNAAGRDQLSRMLGPDLLERLPRGTPLMSRRDRPSRNSGKD